MCFHTEKSSGDMQASLDTPAPSVDLRFTRLLQNPRPSGLDGLPGRTILSAVSVALICPNPIARKRLFDVNTQHA